MPARPGTITPLAAAVSIGLHAVALGLFWLASSRSSPTTLDLSNGAGDSAPEGVVAMLWSQPASPTPPAPQVEVTAAPIDPSPMPPAQEEHELLPELALQSEPTPTPSPTPAAPAAEEPTPITLDPEAFRAVATQLRQTASTIASTLAAFRIPFHPGAPIQTSASAPSTAAPSPPASSTPGGQVSSPSPLSTNKAPQYPLEARRRRQEGTVIILIEVLPTGAVGTISLKTSSGFALLDAAALTAAKDWHFSPATSESLPVQCQVTLPVQFSLKR